MNCIAKSGLLLALLPLQAVFAADRPVWFVDAGGRTLQAASDSYGSAGMRLGRVINNYHLGFAVHHLVEQAQPQTSRYQYLKRYEAAGFYAERFQLIGRRIMLSEGMLVSAAFVQWEQRDMDSIGTGKGLNYALEPGVSVAGLMFDRFWLSVGGSYLFSAGSGSDGIENGPTFNIYARYRW